MNTDFDTLRQNWKQLDTAPGPRAAGQHFCPPDTVNAISRRQKLLNYYRRLSIVGIIFIWCSPLTLTRLEFPNWAVGLVTLYFGLMAGLCIMMYRRIRRIDFGNTPIITLLEQVESIYTLYNRQTTIGILLACPILLMMLYFMHANEAAFLGGITGAIVGTIVGIINNIRFRRYIREIRNELSMALSTE